MFLSTPRFCQLLIVALSLARAIHMLYTIEPRNTTEQSLASSGSDGFVMEFVGLCADLQIVISYSDQPSLHSGHFDLRHIYALQLPGRS
jgi:hypothetical protein